MTIAVRSEEEWAALCRVMHRIDLVSDPRFADMPKRHEHRRDLDAIIGAWTAERDAYWVMERLQAAGVPAGPVMTEGDALRDPHLASRAFFRAIEHPATGTQRHAGREWKASETPNPLPRHPGHPVLLGEDNDYVYRELLGFSVDECRRFEELGHRGMDYDPSIT